MVRLLVPHHKYIYAIANDHLVRHSSQSEEIMQISKKDLQIKRIWTFKIWNKSAKGVFHYRLNL